MQFTEVTRRVSSASRELINNRLLGKPPGTDNTMSKTSSSEIAQIEKLLKVAFDNHATELRLSAVCLRCHALASNSDNSRYNRSLPKLLLVLFGPSCQMVPTQKFSFTCSHGPIDASVVEVSGTEVLVLKEYRLRTRGRW